MSEKEIDKLVKSAIEAKDKSYSPYSNFRVGAALLTENNNIIQGCNIENISFTPTVCAERSAFFTSIISGDRKFRAIAIATDDIKFSPPCGVCRQVMAEFVKSDFEIILVNNKSEFKILQFQDIFPYPFEPSESIGMKE
ncbi:MAG: Cytidine deaminase [Candidatus Heimdallarchaeota archaeon LC_2]|nr:MAG: Cytidine deaminase [Candidatus Heimdallarchaeota archaeon LC_2]